MLLKIKNDNDAVNWPVYPLNPRKSQETDSSFKSPTRSWHLDFSTPIIISRFLTPEL